MNERALSVVRSQFENAHNDKMDQKSVLRLIGDIHKVGFPLQGDAGKDLEDKMVEAAAMLYRGTQEQREKISRLVTGVIDNLLSHDAEQFNIVVTVCGDYDELLGTAYSVCLGKPAPSVVCREGDGEVPERTSGL